MIHGLDRAKKSTRICVTEFYRVFFSRSGRATYFWFNGSTLWVMPCRVNRAIRKLVYSRFDRKALWWFRQGHVKRKMMRQWRKKKQKQQQQPGTDRTDGARGGCASASSWRTASATWCRRTWPNAGAATWPTFLRPWWTSSGAGPASSSPSASCWAGWPSPASGGSSPSPTATSNPNTCPVSLSSDLLFFIDFFFFSFLFLVKNRLLFLAKPIIIVEKLANQLIKNSVYWILLDFTGFHWALPGFTGFYWVLLGFTGFYWVLLG